MPRVYKPKNGFKQRIALDKAKMKQAVTAILGGLPIKASARQFDLPVMSLKRYYRKKLATDKDIEYGPVYGASSRAFTDEEERMLTEYVIKASKMNFGLTPSSVRQLAYQFAVANNKPVAEKWEEMATYDWYYGFMRRNTSLSLRKAEATSLSRGTSFNKHNVDKFYANLKAIQERFHFGPSDTWNLDETGTSTVQNPGNVVAEKGTKQASKATSAERGETVTTCCAINAAGGFIPPFMVFPRKNWQPRMINNCYPGTVGVTHPSGWMTTTNFVKFLEHFLHHTRYSVDRPCLMVMDNHESHVSVDAIRFAKANGIHLLTIPPHTSHKLQPLDRCVYAPFKLFYNRACNDWMTQRCGKTISIYEIAEFTNTAFTRAFTANNIRRSFEVTGIYPFNSNLFTEEDFLTSYVTDRPDPAEGQAAQQVPQEVELEAEQQIVQAGEPQAVQQEVEAGDLQAAQPADQMRNSEGIPTELKPAQQDLEAVDSTPRSTVASGQRRRRKPARYRSDDASESEPTKKAFPPATTSKLTTPTIKQETFLLPTVKKEPADGPIRLKITTPEEIRPFPKASPRKGTRKGRKRGETRVLTDTPVKQQIEEEHKVKQEKKLKKEMNQSKKARRKL